MIRAGDDEGGPRHKRIVIYRKFNVIQRRAGKDVPAQGASGAAKPPGISLPMSKNIDVGGVYASAASWRM
jgi:hypothetical protein